MISWFGMVITFSSLEYVLLLTLKIQHSPVWFLPASAFSIFSIGSFFSPLTGSGDSVSRLCPGSLRPLFIPLPRLWFSLMLKIQIWISGQGSFSKCKIHITTCLLVSQCSQIIFWSFSTPAPPGCFPRHVNGSSFCQILRPRSLGVTLDSPAACLFPAGCDPSVVNYLVFPQTQAAASLLWIVTVSSKMDFLAFSFHSPVCS